jgi:D-sedoheptulose 7-phosphate isomerase
VSVTVRRTRDLAKAYLLDFSAILDALDLDAIERVVERLRVARDGNATVFIAGNGGSAATASHFANDLGKATKRSGRGSIRVMSLCDNASWMTALANDEGYERVFSGQLENFAQPGDVLVVISASGNSPNLVDAAALATSRQVDTIALVGFDGGELLAMADVAVHVATELGAYGPVETAHSLVADIVTCCLMEDREPGVEEQAR